jgi:hypothetical protein
MGLFIILTLLVLLIIIDLILSRNSDKATAQQFSELDLQELGLPSSWDEHYNHHRPWLRLQEQNQVDIAASAPGRRQGPHTLNDHDSKQ